MNRAQKRASAKKDKSQKKLYSLQDVKAAISVALEMKKHSKGHLFSKNLKDHCTFCGATTKTKKTCDFWFMTLLDRIQTVLINPDFFTDENVQALWLQHGEEYQNIKLPMNFGTGDDKKA